MMAGWPVDWTPKGRSPLSTFQGHGTRSFAAFKDTFSEGAVEGLAKAFSAGCWAQTRRDPEQCQCAFSAFAVSSALGDTDEWLFTVDMSQWPEGEGFGSWFSDLMKKHEVLVWD